MGHLASTFPHAERHSASYSCHIFIRYCFQDIFPTDNRLPCDSTYFKLIFDLGIWQNLVPQTELTDLSQKPLRSLPHSIALVTISIITNIHTSFVVLREGIELSPLLHDILPIKPDCEWTELKFPMKQKTYVMPLVDSGVVRLVLGTFFVTKSYIKQYFVICKAIDSKWRGITILCLEHRKQDIWFLPRWRQIRRLDPSACAVGSSKWLVQSEVGVTVEISSLLEKFDSFI